MKKLIIILITLLCISTSIAGELPAPFQKVKELALSKGEVEGTSHVYIFQMDDIGTVIMFIYWDDGMVAIFGKENNTGFGVGFDPRENAWFKVIALEMGIPDFKEISQEEACILGFNVFRLLVGKGLL